MSLIKHLTGPIKIKIEYPSASFLADNKVVFNIKGNHYRLILKINYDYQMIWIRFIGTHAHITDSSTIVKIDTLTYSAAYFANAKDAISGNTGSIYFFFEKYNRLSSAKNKYASIKKANEKHEGVKVLQNIGDEAYFHSDGENFYFIMVRKGKNVFNMKVNKITSKTSLSEFNQIAKNITNTL